MTFSSQLMSTGDGACQHTRRSGNAPCYRDHQAFHVVTAWTREQFTARYQDRTQEVTITISFQPVDLETTLSVRPFYIATRDTSRSQTFPSAFSRPTLFCYSGWLQIVQVWNGPHIFQRALLTTDTRWVKKTGHLMFNHKFGRLNRFANSFA